MKFLAYYLDWSVNPARPLNMMTQDESYAHRVWQAAVKKKEYRVWEVEAPNIETVFYQLNADDRTNGAFERSLSVGDIVIDPEKREGWLVRSVGFGPLPEWLLQLLFTP